jgi:histidinol phosphatase-like PHP family hydrolase
MNRKDHSRFWKEIRRAKEQKIKLIILVEHGGKIKSIQDVTGWTDKYSGVSGRRLMEEIYRVHISYGVEFMFCDKRRTARKIIEILSQIKED